MGTRLTEAGKTLASRACHGVWQERCCRRDRTKGRMGLLMVAREVLIMITTATLDVRWSDCTPCFCIPEYAGQVSTDAVAVWLKQQQGSHERLTRTPTPPSLLFRHHRHRRCVSPPAPTDRRMRCAIKLSLEPPLALPLKKAARAAATRGGSRNGR